MNHSAGDSYRATKFRNGQMSRNYRRAGLPGFFGDIADGNLIVGGMIDDISTGGFRMTGIPEIFKAEKHTYAVVLSGGGKHYRLLAKPCWKKKGSGPDQAEMGFKIIDAPWEWVELTMKEIPEFDYEDFFASFN